MSYLPHTDRDRREMLAAIGAESFEDLLAEIPESIRFRGDLHLPPPLSQQEVEEEFDRLAAENRRAAEKDAFLGGGVYDHYVPSIVGATLARPEFYSAYTPYQAEVSQGTLQTVFEFQSLLSRLTGMPLANASLYDGATALVEGVWMARAEGKGRTEIVLPRSLSPRYRAVLRTHLAAAAADIREIDFGEDGFVDAAALDGALSDKTAVVVVQSPNYFGLIEETDRIAERAHRAGALFLQVFDPISLALIRTPGEAGADIAVGEGQSLGGAIGFGGPLLGLFTAQERFLRKMPGRLVGMTEDLDGERAFTLTLQTREQHIRREKATSNICTNQGLMALGAMVYLAALGQKGLRRAALLSQERALELRKELAAAGASFPFDGPFFREFPVVFPDRAVRLGLLPYLFREGIVPGLPLQGHYPALGDAYLTAVTERRSRESIRRFGETVARFLRGIREEEDGHA
ncbi:MAG: aminomethyl-transferring glycine dehydrogenase subunit GcvPA [Candidatus Eisenbacteria bacterium]|nr:aminomethyl-transferring glycine dehydrogenase subunit GcvPA [Candidatus Eisenbacteria bacterium]